MNSNDKNAIYCKLAEINGLTRSDKISMLLDEVRALLDHTDTDLTQQVQETCGVYKQCAAKWANVAQVYRSGATADQVYRVVTTEILK